MTKLIEDESKHRVYTKSRRIGHITSLLAMLSLAHHAARYGTASLNSEKCVLLGFLLLAWFFFLPVILFIGDPKYYGKQMKDMMTMQRWMIYYISPAVFIVAFTWLAFTSWSS